MSTKAQRDAVRALFGDVVLPDVFVGAVVDTVQRATVQQSRWVVVTRDPNNDMHAFGPYASRASARKVIESGALASLPDTRAAVLVMRKPGQDVDDSP